MHEIESKRSSYDQERNNMFTDWEILSEYKNLKHISGIKSRRQRELIPSMLNRDGEEVHDRQSIANVFTSL